jgi:hypothetical protein
MSRPRKVVPPAADVLADLNGRVEKVRTAIAEASTGLEGQAYRDFMEVLLADADGWRMELEESGDEDED